MLKFAKLYETKLLELHMESFTDIRNQWYYGTVGGRTIELEDPCDGVYQYVSVDSNDNVLGYIKYEIDWYTKSAWKFGIISYKHSNVIFAQDVFTVIKKLFEEQNVNRISWYAFSENPVMRSYLRFIKSVGGRICSYERQTNLLMDGKLHDSYQFEIMKDAWDRYRENGYKPVTNFRNNCHIDSAISNIDKSILKIKQRLSEEITSEESEFLEGQLGLLMSAKQHALFAKSSVEMMEVCM